MEDAHLPQGTIRYRDTGSGEPLIFIHGLLVDSRLWDPAVALLSDGHRCIQPDLPLGCHRVPMNADADLTPPGVARLLIDFMDELGLERATLVGNDSGGAISQLVATAHPDRVGRLILTNSDTYSDFPPKLFAYLNVVKWFPSVLTGLAQSMRLKPLRHSPLAYGVLSKTRLDDELLKSWLEPALGDAAIRRDTAKFIKGVSPRLTEQAAVDLQGFRSPTLFAWAPEDRWFKIANAERLAASMPDARVVRIPGAKTFVPIDQPRGLADGIASFVAANEPRSATAAG